MCFLFRVHNMPGEKDKHDLRLSVMNEAYLLYMTMKTTKIQQNLKIVYKGVIRTSHLQTLKVNHQEEEDNHQEEEDQEE